MWSLILTPEFFEVLAPRQVLAVGLACWNSYLFAMPFVYRHVNLIDLPSFYTFRASVTDGCLGGIHPGCWVQTLQISFDLDDLSTKSFQKFSDILQVTSNLFCLNICYSHFGCNWVRHLKDIALSFPLTLKVLHLKPLGDEQEVYEGPNKVRCSEFSLTPDINLRTRRNIYQGPRKAFGATSPGLLPWPT